MLAKFISAIFFLLQTSERMDLDNCLLPVKALVLKLFFVCFKFVALCIDEGFNF